MTDAVGVGELLFNADRSWPYPTYDVIRAQGLTHSAWGPWVAADYETVRAVLRDHRFGVDGRVHPDHTPPEPNYFDGDRAVPEEAMLLSDPPAHTRVRRLVSKAFTPRAVAQLRAYMEEVTDALLDGLLERRDVDLVDEFAFPIPLAVICRILGVPAEDRALFQAWGEDLVPSLDPFQTDEQVAKARVADAEMTRYIDELIAQRRRAPTEDLLSEMVAAEEEGDRLSEEELLGNVSLIFGAGFETTVNLIGNGVLALLRHPAELARLRADPSLIPNAVNELLRYDSPVQMTSRIALEPVDVAGHHFDQFDEIIVLLGGANRDPAVFERPDVVEVARANASEHVAFSSGTHYCLGAALARAEGEVAFGRLLERATTIELRGEPEPRPFMVLHGLAKLPLTLSA
ncbi:MAG: hypothetical protein QOK28_1322 [Actinomycetota bacterium]